MLPFSCISLLASASANPRKDVGMLGLEWRGGKKDKKRTTSSESALLDGLQQIMKLQPELHCS